MTDDVRTLPMTEQVPAQKRWRVTTRATVIRTYFVEADDEKGAEAASVEASFDLEEDENEETMEVSEAPQ